MTDLTEGSKEWRNELIRASDLLKERNDPEGEYPTTLNGALGELVGEPERLMLFVSALVTFGHQLVLSLDQALQEMGTKLEYDKLVDETRKKLEMHSGLDQFEHGDTDDLLDTGD